MTAAAKDGKPAKVSQEVVTITKNGKQTVRVTVEPAPSLPPIVNKTRAVVRDALLAERLRQAFPGADANHLALMRLAGQAALARAETTPLSVDRLPSHKDFPRLEELMGMASWPVIAPDRLHTVLDEAYQLAGTILNDSAAPTAVNPKKSPTQPTNKWEDRLKKLVTEAQAVADRLVKTAPGRVLLTAGPGADPDKVTAGMDKDDAFRAKRLLVLRDEFGRLVPEAQKGIGRWEKARHEVQVRDTKYNAGTIPVTDPEAARIELTDAERSLKAAEDAMTRTLADLKKLADEIETAASPEGEFKKVMAEYDAIVLRLAKHPVGRVLTLVGEKWTEGELERRGLEPPDVQRAMKLLKLRDEIKSQAQKVTSAFSARQQNQENLAKHTGPDLDSERWRTNITEDLRLCEQAAKVGTETIRGLLVDLKKLADELDPPKPTAETLEAEYKKVLAEYDALLLRLVNTRVGRVLALYDKEPNSDKYLKDAGVPDAAVPTAWKLFDLRQKILAQKHDADEHLSRLHMKNNATVPTDEHGLKFRTGALRGLVDDLKKLADELDPPDKKVGPTGKDSGKQ